MKLRQLAINKGGILVSIYNVLPGKKCNCFCGDCNAPLVAKNKGKQKGLPLSDGQKAAHFAHKNECSYTKESDLHLLAKEVLKSSMKLGLPEYSLSGSSLIKTVKPVQFTGVKLECFNETGEIKPDAILTKGDVVLFVEFYKTNVVDFEKRKKIERLGIPTIEIDINSIEPIADGSPN